MSLGSGSSGNCYYLAAGRTAILIDAGIGIRKTKSILKDNGIDIGTIDAVLITHDHLDHVRSAGWLGERAGIPVYATAEVIGGINRNYCIRQKLRGSARAVTKGERVVIGDFAATPFAVPPLPLPRRRFAKALLIGRAVLLVPALRSVPKVLHVRFRRLIQ